MENPNKLQKFGSPFTPSPTFSPTSLGPSPMDINDDLINALFKPSPTIDLPMTFASPMDIEGDRNQYRTYLESLPYEAFINIIRTGKIEAKDLISYCLSSPIINEKCNRDLVNGNGEVIPQFLFYKILEGMGINPGPNPREKYVMILRYQEAHESLAQKFNLLQQMTNSDEFETYGLKYDNLSTILFDSVNGLFLQESVKYPNIIESVRNILVWLENTIRSLIGLKDDLTVNLNSYYLHNLKRELSEFRERINNDPNVSSLKFDLKFTYGDYESLKQSINVEDLYALNRGIIYYANLLRLMLNYNEKSLATIVSNNWEYNLGGLIDDLRSSIELNKEYTRGVMEDLLDLENGRKLDSRVVLSILNNSDPDNLTDADLIVIKSERIATIKEELTLIGDHHEKISNVESIMKLSENEIEYLLYLYLSVLLGNIPVFETFDFQKLVKFF